MQVSFVPQSFTCTALDRWTRKEPAPHMKIRSLSRPSRLLRSVPPSVSRNDRSDPPCCLECLVRLFTCTPSGVGLTRGNDTSVADVFTAALVKTLDTQTTACLSHDHSPLCIDICVHYDIMQLISEPSSYIGNSGEYSLDERKKEYDALPRSLRQVPCERELPPMLLDTH